MSSLSPDLQFAISSVAAVETLLVAVDFDGTLAPLVDDPADSRMLPAARAALLDLADVTATHAAVISGRALEVLDELTGLPASVTLVGSHGSEFRIDGVIELPELSEPDRTRVEEICAVVDSVSAKFRGALFERKPAGAGLHTRRSSRSDAEEAEALALRLVTELDARGDVASAHRPTVIRRGKDILEFSLGEADKGESLRRLRGELGADAIVFLGDDVTDEDGFEALLPDDVGVKVGTGPSLARYRVSDPGEAANVLEALRDARREHAVGANRAVNPE